MTAQFEDTIAAICSGVGGAISIIRISGVDALAVANRCWRGKTLLSRRNARMMRLGHTVVGGGAADKALAVFMPGPNSYTGEDVVELHCHGGAVAARQALAAVLAAGARAAGPGEFTKRSFINGKMDLTQAEAVADLINAHSEMALRLAERQVSGVLGAEIRELRGGLTSVLAECESRLDFGDEDLAWTPTTLMARSLADCLDAVAKLNSSVREGAVLRDGVRMVIAGRPNSGKSSLLNLLLGYDRAIVATVPGTTRDTLEEYATLRGVPVKLIDTAGIREADDAIECQGVERSRASIAGARIILWLLDASGDQAGELAELRRHLSAHRRIVAVWNKIDLRDETLEIDECPSVSISVTRKKGIKQLLDVFESQVWGFPHGQAPEVAVGARHAKLLEEAMESLTAAITAVEREEWELAAVDIRAAVAALGKITGETVEPDILDDIFSRFCIGK